MNKVKLSSIIDIISGGTPKTDEKRYWENGTIGWLSVTDFNNDLRYVYSTEKQITDEGLKNSSTKLLNKGDIIISARGTVGALAQIGKPMCFNQSCFGFRGKRGIVETDFLYYALKNYVHNIKNRSQGSVFDKINLNSFDLMEIEIPKELTTQQKIASVLSALDSKIELNNRINAELEAMAKTLYDYWFVQFDFPDKNGKPYKTIGGKMVWNEELKREIPEGWEVKSIDYYANVIDPHPSHRAPLEVIDGYPFAGIGDIDEFGIIDINKARVIDEEFVLKQERDYTINDYSIGYGRVGTVGKVVKLRKQPFRFALSPTMAIINPKNNSLPSFVYFTVNNPTFLQWVNKYTSGSTRPAIGIQHLRTIPVIKPIVYSENLLEKFEKAVESSFKQTDILNKENQKLTELRDWLLPMLMNRQVKIN
jgi:type I restriction enzyme S subunit